MGSKLSGTRLAKYGAIFLMKLYEIQYAKDVSTFKSYISKHSGNICKCNLCKLYIANLGYVENNLALKPP